MICRAKAPLTASGLGAFLCQDGQEEFILVNIFLTKTLKHGLQPLTSMIRANGFGYNDARSSEINCQING
jgi:hypothetical protein